MIVDFISSSDIGLLDRLDFGISLDIGQENWLILDFDRFCSQVLVWIGFSDIECDNINK